MANPTGQVIPGYELLERIGAGGFGAVYRAYHSTVGREVAVKVILPAYANHPEFIRRFEREAQLIARLEHLHIVPLYDYWRDPNGAYIVMRWLRGGSLRAALRDGAFDLAPASLLLDQVAAGLAAAHDQQIVHRDLKPSNILLDEEGNAYLADFGIATDLRRANGTTDSSAGRDRLNSRGEEQILGSVQYLSPEQLTGQEATPQSDIYSLGITLYEMLSGQHPFPGVNSVQQLYKHIDEPLPRIDMPDPEVSEGVNEVIFKATAKNPEHRYQDALAMAVAFQDAARLGRDGQTVDLVESLTRREQEILHLIIQGNMNQEIAQALFLELSTVKWHVNRIYKKLGVRSRVQAVVRARELDLIVPTPETEMEPAQKTGISVVLPAPANPYKGLRAFEPADNRHFFGREALVEQLLSRLAPTNASSPSRSAIGLATNGSERFLAIVGPSGSGKSSLIKAGLIPALWSGQLPGSDKWFIVDMLPGARPLDNLEIALTRIAADQADNIRQHLDRDANGLSRAARLILPNDESELLVVIDQFEELFTLVRDEAARKHFIDLIQGAATDPHSRVRVVIALRADYYDRPLQYPDFGELVRRHLETLLPLSAEELERAIVNPAHQAGVTFEPGLVATIIEDVNYRPGALPLLQYALAELFELRDERLLTLSAYLALGGAAGALARRAEELYQEQGDDGRETIRQMFLRLVSVGDPVTGAGSEALPPADTRKRVLRSELLSAACDPGRLDEIIDTYADFRLLSLDYHAATRQATVEVAHEAILREWDRLQAWLEESRGDLSLHNQLVRATHEWIEAGGDPSFLIRGTRLDRFESWASDTQLVLTEDERAFLSASLALSEQKAAAERERQEREARLERQSNRRLKSLVIVMAVALLAAIGLASSAVSFARRVEEKDRVNLATELIYEARANLESDPELSVLLALEAAEAAFAADGNLLSGVEELLHQAVQADLVQSTIWHAGVVAFSPDGQSLAVGTDRGPLRIWDLTSGLWDRKLGSHETAISAIAFSQDSQFLATAGRDSLVKIVHMASGQYVGYIRGQQKNRINALAFPPNGTQLVTTGVDGSVRIWELEPVTGRAAEDGELVELSESTLILQRPWEAGDVAYPPGGERIAVLFPGKSILIVDPASAEPLLEIAVDSGSAAGLAFSPEGNYLAGSSSDLQATVWDVRTGDEILSVRESSKLVDVAISPDGRYLATATENGKISLWDMETGLVALRLSGHSSRIISISFSPDGRRLATSSAERVTRIWEVDRLDGELFAIAAHKGKVHDAIFSPDGTQIASTGEDGTVKVWDAATGRLLHSLPGQREWVHFPVFSPDGDRLAAANREGGISIWNADTGEEQLALVGDAPAFTAIAFSPDGSRLAAGGQGGFAHIWDASTGQMLANLSYEGDTIMELIYTHGGDQIRSYDWAGREMAWDAATGEWLGESPGAPTYWDVELTKDGERVAMACSQVVVNTFSEINGVRTNIYTLQGGGSEFTGVAFYPEGTVLATSSSSGELKLWDMETGQEITKLSHSRPSLGGVDISPDGRYLVTAGSDGTVSVFILSMEELMEVARARLSRGFTHAECQRYLHLPACAED